MIGYGRYHFRYATGREGDWCVLGLASHKRYISLYVTAEDGRGGYLAEATATGCPRPTSGRAVCASSVWTVSTRRHCGSWSVRRRRAPQLRRGERDPQPVEKVFDSPTGWVARHHRGLRSDRREEGSPLARRRHPAAHHRGRRSGKLRRTALIYGRDGNRYIVVASRGGAKHHPSWYLNLVEHPEVTIQVGSETFTARARTANADEKPGLWRLMTAIWPDYDRYQAKTDRDIPVVIIEPS